jgi:hypothetical protein
MGTSPRFIAYFSKIASVVRNGRFGHVTWFSANKNAHEQYTAWLSTNRSIVHRKQKGLFE